MQPQFWHEFVIWDIVKPDIGKMVHYAYDEIVLHIGGDPNDPRTGADMDFGMGDELLH